MDNNDNEYEYDYDYDYEVPTLLDKYGVRWGKLYIILFVPCIAGWIALLLNFPLTWAYSTGGVLTVGLGLFTARIVFQMQPFAKALAFSPILGTCWLALFWLVYKLSSP